VHKGRLNTIASFLPYVIPTICIGPSIIWIALDTSAWGGDQSQYGTATLDLFRTLTQFPHEWPYRMLDVFPWKPNGLIWFGQLFVPFAYVTSSVDTALLLSVIVAQVVTLVLVYRSLQVLSPNTSAVPSLACLVIASSPFFIGFAHHYLVETFQTMVVAWFVLVMSMAPRWNRVLLVAQLTAATAFAMAAKANEPLFCLWPGVVACVYLLRPRQGQVDGSRRTTFVSVALAVPVACFTAAWYLRNWTFVTRTFYEASFGHSVRTLWGKEDAYLHTLAFWANTAREIHFLPGVCELSLLLIASGVCYVTKARSVPKHFTLCAAVSAVQIATVLLVFSLSPARQSRYLLPILPYIAVLVAWSVVRINHWAATATAVGVFALQLVLLHGRALNVLPVRSAWLNPFDRHARSGRTLDSLVARTCPESAAAGYWNVLAVDPEIPELQGDWLAPEPANYVVAKNRLWRGGGQSCHYDYLGDGFFGSDVSRAWNSVLSHQARHVIVVDPAVYPTPAQTANEALSRQNFPIIFRQLETGGLFELDEGLVEDPGILIFRRVDHVGNGRALSDRGLHEQAVAVLRKATTLEPTNVEAWANLALACERQGSFQEAIAAATRARQLKPDHYYVDMTLARAFFQQKKWTEVVRNAQEAESHAPAVRERADALVLAARGAFRSRDVNGGCDFLRRAGLTPSSDILGELPSDACEKR
jgi:Tetratricopeptide repeat